MQRNDIGHGGLTFTLADSAFAFACDFRIVADAGHIPCIEQPAAAERVLERDGLPGLTLRAVAREAGVSHAAPTHHFGDLTGLLSELAAVGVDVAGDVDEVTADLLDDKPGQPDETELGGVIVARSGAGALTLPISASDATRAG